MRSHHRTDFAAADKEVQLSVFGCIGHRASSLSKCIELGDASGHRSQHTAILSTTSLAVPARTQFGTHGRRGPPRVNPHQPTTLNTIPDGLVPDCLGCAPRRTISPKSSTLGSNTKSKNDLNTSRTDDQLLTRQHAQAKFWSMREADFHALARSLRSNADADVRCDDRAWRDPGSTRTDAKGVVWVRPKRVHGVQNAIYIGARRVNFADRAPRIVSSIRSRLPVPENKDQLTTVVVRISRPCRGHTNKACQA